MAYAYNEFTQYVSVSKGSLVEDGVNEGGFVAVIFSVAVGVDEGVTTAGEVAVKVKTSVDGMEENVAVIFGGAIGFWKETKAIIIRRMLPTIAGIKCF